MGIHQFQTARKVVFGRRSFQQLAELLKQMGEIRNVFVLAHKSIEREGYWSELEQQLHKAGISCDAVIGVEPEPTEKQMMKLHRQIKEKNYDVLIGIGGGSALDTVKVLSVLQTNPMTIREMTGIGNIRNAGVRTVLVPTTSGTGAEVTPNAIVTFPEQRLKIGIVSPYLLPDLAVIDPMLTLTLPKPITAASGMDAFTHAFESFISNKSNPLSDMYALESMRLISDSIVTAFEHGDDIEARENMLLGSMYGGMALTSAGTAAVHALAYAIGGQFGITHGVANAMLLPHVTECNLDVIGKKMIKVAEVIGVEGRDEDTAAKHVMEQIVLWTKRLNIPQQLDRFGAQSGDVPQLAKNAVNVTRLMDNNPKKLSVEDVERIFLKLLPQQ